MRKREFLPYIIGAATGIFSVLIVLSMPKGSFLGFDLRIAVLALLGFLTYKIFGWSRNLFSEMPP